MDNWQIFIVIGEIVALMAVIIPFFVKNSKVIQKNTDAINHLTEKMNDITVNNTRDHDHFHSSINALERDVAVLKEKHNRKENR